MITLRNSAALMLCLPFFAYSGGDKFSSFGGEKGVFRLQDIHREEQAKNLQQLLSKELGAFKQNSLSAVQPLGPLGLLGTKNYKEIQEQIRANDKTQLEFYNYIQELKKIGKSMISAIDSCNQSFCAVDGNMRVEDYLTKGKELQAYTKEITKGIINSEFKTEEIQKRVETVLEMQKKLNEEQAKNWQKDSAEYAEQVKKIENKLNKLQIYITHTIEK